MTVEFGDLRVPARFWAKVQRGRNGCWHWTARVSPTTGYGHLAVSAREGWPAHRYFFHHLVRPLIPRGQPGHLQVDHECHNRSKSCQGGPTCLHRRCVNPAHLAPRTPVENTHESRWTPAAKNRAKTHCLRGHPLSGDNLRVTAAGKRNCNACGLDRGNEARRQRLRAERGEDWRKVEWNSKKTRCPQGHPLSGKNLYVVPSNGARQCRTCRAAAGKRHAEKTPRGIAPADRVHCVNGHPFDEANTGLSGGKRYCRTCKRQRSLASYHKSRGHS